MSAEPVPVDLTPDKVAMRAHLDHLFGAVPPAFQDGLVEIAYTTPDGEIKYAQLFKLDALDDAVEFAAAVNGKEGFSVYVGAALRKPMKRKTGRCGEAEFYAALSLWADLDDEEPVKAAGGKCSAAMPNFALYSGRYPHVRMQLFWRLAEPITNSKAMRPPLAAICTHLDGDEKVVEPARLMRLAGSIAWPHKPDRVAEMTGVLRIKTPGPEAYPLQDLMAAYAPPGNVVNLAEIRNVTRPAPASPVATTEWGKLTDGREGAMRDFVWRWVVDLYRDAPIEPSEAAWQQELEKAWAEFARTITVKEPGHTLEDEGRGETEFAHKWRYAMRHWDTKVRDAAQVPPPGDAPQDDGISRPEQPDPLSGFTTANSEAPPAERFPFETMDDIFNLPAARWLVPKWIPEGGIGILYGKWGSGKSFLALDLALHLVYGFDHWHGADLPDDGCEVLIIAREGGSGFKNRMKAFMNRHGLTQRTLRIRFMRAGVNFMNDQDFNLFVGKMRLQARPWKLVIVDTVARVIPGVEMSKPEVVTKFMERCQQIGEATDGAAVVGIHHKNKTGTMMGSVYFEANADFVFSVERDEEGGGLSRATIQCTKMKDGEDGWEEPVLFQQYAATFGESSLAVESIGAVDGSQSKSKRPHGDEMPSRDVIRRMLDIISERWIEGKPLSLAPQSKEQGRYAPRVLSKVSGAGPGKTERIIEELIDNGVLIVDVVKAHSRLKGLRVIGNVDY